VAGGELPLFTELPRRRVFSEAHIPPRVSLCVRRIGAKSHFATP
jgi:hypothetical protein